MGSPGQRLHLSMDIENLRTLVRHEFPDFSVVVAEDGQVSIVTLHGVGLTEREALEGCLEALRIMKEDALSLQQMLDDVNEELSIPGMSKDRHDFIQDILAMCNKALSDGVITGLIPWITVPGRTKEIDRLKQRVETRLGMQAQAMQEKEKATKKAAQKFPRSTTQTYAELRAKQTHFK